MTSALRSISEIEIDSNGNVVKVDLSRKRITDDGVRQLKSLTELEELSLSGGQGPRKKSITNASLQHLQSLVKLKALDISHAAITNDGLAHLGGLKNLEMLDLSATKITDDGLAHLAEPRPIDLSAP